MTNAKRRRKTTAAQWVGYSALATSLFVGAIAPLAAGPREQAKRIHDRLAGVPPTETVLASMATLISANDAEGAADIALENSAFYNVTLKNMITPWTNEAQTVFAPLNDYTATVIGMVRDDVPFNQILSADILYTGAPGLGLPAYSMNNNDHYAAMEAQGVDLKDNLVATTQSALTDLPSAATAGVITTRAAAEAFFVAGTNRSMFRFTMLNHLCTDLEQIKDVTRAPDRVRQDVSRSPGGDSRLFLNACVGCHAGMDPLTQALAYYDYDETAGRILYNDVGAVDPISGGRVQGKYRINASNFEPGFITENDNWDNYWRNGPNALLGWNESLPSSGSGAKSMGNELANSEAFARCQVKKVFKNVCFRDAGNGTDRSQIDAMTASFKANNYSLKRVFAETAAYCMGD
ncbi:MAG: hypothetical protein GXP10_01035 [Gammaproteobacteria bacterium]|nr:hypothetical protein [Gammaproteobacteria bacterium]